MDRFNRSVPALKPRKNLPVVQKRKPEACSVASGQHRGWPFARPSQTMAPRGYPSVSSPEQRPAAGRLRKHPKRPAPPHSPRQLNHGISPAENSSIRFHQFHLVSPFSQWRQFKAAAVQGRSKPAGQAGAKRALAIVKNPAFGCSGCSCVVCHFSIHRNIFSNKKSFNQRPSPGVCAPCPPAGRI